MESRISIFLIIFLALASIANGDTIRIAVRGKKQTDQVTTGEVVTYDRANKELLIQTPRSNNNWNTSPQNLKKTMTDKQSETIAVDSILRIEITPAPVVLQGCIVGQITNSADDCNRKSRDILSEAADSPREQDLISCKGSRDWLVRQESNEKLYGSIVKIEGGYVYFDPQDKKKDEKPKQFLKSSLSEIMINGCS